MQKLGKALWFTDLHSMEVSTFVRDGLTRFICPWEHLSATFPAKGVFLNAMKGNLLHLE